MTTPPSGNIVAVISNGTAILGLGRSRRARLQAGDGGQGSSLQALRRRRFDRSRGRHRGCRRVHQRGALSRAHPSAASTWRTSRRRNASSSSSGCKELMDIPVFHDDQHGTAIIATAGLINALHLTGPRCSRRQDRLQRRGCGGHRLRRAHQVTGSSEPQRDARRFQGRGLSGPCRGA
jgi:hypothetical protein